MSGKASRNNQSVASKLIAMGTLAPTRFAGCVSHLLFPVRLLFLLPTPEMFSKGLSPFLPLLRSLRHAPTVFDHDESKFPNASPSNTVQGTPEDLSSLYREAWSSAGTGAFTASVLVCRKMLMHIAVDKGAVAGESLI